MKRFKMIFWLTIVMFVTGLTTLAAQVKAFPDRPIELVVPLPPGSAVDTAARLLADNLGRTLGMEVIVVNKPGASLTVGTGLVARSKKDGYTIAYTATSGIVYARVTNPDTVPYDPDKDLEPLALHLFFPLAVVVQASSPWKTFADFVAYAKANPRKIRVGTNGQATIDHFNMGIVQSEAGVQFTHVPFKGGDQTTTAVLGGHVEAISHSYTLVKPHVDAGKLRILLVSRKVPEAPELPTITDLGYKQGLLSPWFALYAPAGIPADVRDILVKSIRKAIDNPEMTAKLAKMGFMVDYKSPEELRTIAREDYEKASAIADELGLKKK